MQQLGINRLQEFADKIERVRVENNFELEKQRLELEHKKIEMEDRLRQKEIELKDSIAASTNVLPTSFLGTNSSSSVRKVKLPKLDFPKFSGDILSWKEFWDSFHAAIDQNQSLAQVDKLNYLKAKLEGHRVSAISGLELTGDNYSVAVTILKERFGKEQVVKDAIQKTNVPSSSNKGNLAI